MNSVFEPYGKLSTPNFSLAMLDPIGQILFLASVGWAIFSVVRGKWSTEQAIISCLIGAMGLFFWHDAVDILQRVSDLLADFFKTKVDSRDFKAHLFDILQKNSIKNQGDSAWKHISETVDAAFSTGVWAVLNSIIEFIFMAADLIIVVSQAVLTKICIVFLPIACGIFPLFPKMLMNILLYIFELSLWRPMLVIIHEVLLLVSKDLILKDSSFTFNIIVVEIVAIFLILGIPKFVDALLKGAISGDHSAYGAIMGFAIGAMTGRPAGVVSHGVSLVNKVASGAGNIPRSLEGFARKSGMKKDVIPERKK